MSVAFDNVELRALNAANIDYDLTFMQVPLCGCFVHAIIDLICIFGFFFAFLDCVRLCLILPFQFLECLVAVSEMMEKSDVVSLAIKVLPPPAIPSPSPATSSLFVPRPQYPNACAGGGAHASSDGGHRRQQAIYQAVACTGRHCR